MQLSPATQLFIREHQSDDVRRLALQAHKYPDVDLPMAITQIAGRKIAAEKIPSWKENEALWFPKHLSMEQCSSEVTARYKAALLQGESFVDLTGGFGVDCSFIAAGFREATYVERQSELCTLAAHNFSALRLHHVRVCHAEAADYLQKMNRVDAIFLDPARRNEHGGKTVAIADCEPDVSQLEDLLLSKACRVMIKLSPMLDLSLALKELPHTQEAHIVSVNNECKELLLLLGQEPPKEVAIHCVNLQTKGVQGEQHFVFTREQEQVGGILCTERLGSYLYEPNASLLKAGAFRSLTAAYPVRKLHPNSHLYTSDMWVEAFPGRAFRIVGQCGFQKKEMKEQLGDLKKANLTVRNFPATVAELRKRTKLSEGGEAYLFATTLSDERKVLIRCVKMEAGEAEEQKRL